MSKELYSGGRTYLQFKVLDSTAFMDYLNTHTSAREHAHSHTHTYKLHNFFKLTMQWWPHIPPDQGAGWHCLHGLSYPRTPAWGAALLEPGVLRTEVRSGACACVH
eukprot:1160935-Pelagomonas_calceolata.AAC.4